MTTHFEVDDINIYISITEQYLKTIIFCCGREKVITGKIFLIFDIKQKQFLRHPTFT